MADLQLASCLLQLPASIKTTFDINTGTKVPKNLQFVNISRPYQQGGEGASASRQYHRQI